MANEERKNQLKLKLETAVLEQIDSVGLTYIGLIGGSYRFRLDHLPAEIQNLQHFDENAYSFWLGSLLFEHKAPKWELTVSRESVPQLAPQAQRLLKMGQIQFELNRVRDIIKHEQHTLKEQRKTYERTVLLFEELQ